MMPIGVRLSSAFSRRVFIILFGSLLLSLLGNYFHPDGLLLLPLRAKPGESRNIPDHIVFVSAGEAVREVGEGRGIIVDIRAAEDYRALHPRNSVNLPYHEFASAFNETADGLPRSMIIFILCEGRLCSMSERVALKLSEYGFRNVSVIRETFGEWKNMGFPVE